MCQAHYTYWRTQGIMPPPQQPKRTVVPIAAWKNLLCHQCGERFDASRRGGRKLYCSERCCRRADVGRKRTRTSGKSSPPFHKECKRCGVSFTAAFASSLYCSKYCRRYGPKKRRDMRKRDAYVADVWRADIQARDKGMCQLCGTRVRFDKQAPHPLSPTIDHIIPIACGGTHEPRNAQLAHFLCNSTKSIYGTDQLRLIG